MEEAYMDRRESRRCFSDAIDGMHTTWLEWRLLHLSFSFNQGTIFVNIMRTNTQTTESDKKKKGKPNRGNNVHSRSIMKIFLFPRKLNGCLASTHNVFCISRVVNW
jgi:hypothetical protein